MIRGMARLMTGGDVAKMLIAILFGAGMGSIVAAWMSGTAKTWVVGIIGAATLAVVVHSGMGVYRRYRQLSEGKCPNPLCHGVVQRSQLVDRGNVVCPTCKKTWPELQSMTFRATARS
ncbi:MAG: BRcat domain-containing protein [Armatimonadota bacterium]|jgi:hypothetical protein